MKLFLFEGSVITNKFNLCKYSIILSVFLLLYIFTDLLINSTSSENSFFVLDNRYFIIKIFALALVFAVVTLVYSYMKTSRRNYINEQVKIKTEEILNDNQIRIKDSKLDPLTQCLNKDFFSQRFKEEYKRAIREKQSLSMLIVNIDEFKAYNDIYGRNEGDECIKLIANILVAQCSRPCDLVSRVENDEFHILLPNTSEAKTVANRSIKAVSSLKIPHENSIASNVLTISIGLATTSPESLSSKEEFIDKAKASLALAKKSGRNRVY